MADIVDRITDEARRAPEQSETITPMKAGFSKTSRAHPAAAALLAGLMIGIGERERDEALVQAGKALAAGVTR